MLLLKTRHVTLMGFCIIVELRYDFPFFFFQCTVLNEKLNLLLNTLSIESEALSTPSRESLDTSGNSGIGSGKPRVFVSKEALMSRANSLKKALKHIIEHAEKGTV